MVVKNGVELCFRHFGPTLLKDVYTFKTVLDSLIPDSSYQQECELIYQAIREVGYKLFEANACSEEVRKYAYRELLQKMLDSEKFAKEKAESVLQILADSLEWKIPELSRFQWLYMLYADKRVGECFAFGRYPQGANGEIKPIIWRVLRRDKNKIFVISERCLDIIPANFSGATYLFIYELFKNYKEKNYKERFTRIPWADCTLRHRLNDEFINRAFCEEEKSLIKPTVNKDNGSFSKDHIFLLSLDEANDLFADDNDRICEPTAYAIAQGAFVSKGNTWWWLRSHGSVFIDLKYVNPDGSIDINGEGDISVYSDGVSVRPALNLAI